MIKVTINLELLKENIQASFNSISDAVDFLEAYKDQSDETVEEVRQFEASLMAKGKSVVEDIKELKKNETM